MNKNPGDQKIKCNVSDCTHNCIENSTCRLEEIQVCPCSHNATKDALKDTACSSYEYSNVQYSERYN